MMRRLLPHITMDVAVIFLVLWVIDRINGPMNMLGRDVFKIPLMVFLLLVIVQSVLWIIEQRRE